MYKLNINYDSKSRTNASYVLEDEKLEVTFESLVVAQEILAPIKVAYVRVNNIAPLTPFNNFILPLATTKVVYIHDGYIKEFSLDDFICQIDLWS